MDWINAAILSPAILGVNSVVDSHILSRRVPSLRFYLLVGGVYHLIWTSAALVVYPLPEGFSLWALVIALVSGVTRAIGITLMFHTMRREEVALVVPVVFTYPVFVALAAIPLLGESLQYLQWLAIFMVVVGAVIVSFKRSASGVTTWPGRLFLLLLGVSFLIAASDVTGKYAVGYLSPWHILILTELCFGIVWLGVSARPAVFREFSKVKQRFWSPMLVVLVETMAVSGVALLFLAMQGGPVSLVSTISGSRPVFVAVVALVLSRLFPKFIMWSAGSATMIVLRLVATAMIVGGISIIYLT